MLANKKAFTLLELLLVSGLIAILAGIVIFALSPSKQLAQTRNSQRSVDVNTIHKAVYQYVIDVGALPMGVSTTPLEICRTDASDCSGLIDLEALSQDAKYLVSIPVDPSTDSENGTGYYICKTPYGRPVVYSPAAELDYEIQTDTPCGEDAFVCGNTLIDSRDSNSYPTVLIGTQCWMKENLAYLPSVSPRTVGSTSSPIYYVYNYDGTDVATAKAQSNYLVYGALYNYPAALTACPAGWHLPSDAEQYTLESYLTDTGNPCDPNREEAAECANAGGKLREAGTAHWLSPNTGADNSSSFTALGAGNRTSLNEFLNQNINTRLWSSTASSTMAYNRLLLYNNTTVRRSLRAFDGGYAVRCLKD